jgi:signal transduction histidine kinase
LLSYRLKHQLYRIVQELLVNISKHAVAKKCFDNDNQSRQFY